MMVAPAELERVLLAHPAVAEAAVVPVRSAGGVLVPKAYIILAQRWNATAATAMAVLTHANSDPSRRRISVLEFVDLLPRTESGKIHRDVLRGYPRSELTEFPAPTGGPSPQGQE
jgi:acetyl-CoA synthetase